MHFGERPSLLWSICILSQLISGFQDEASAFAGANVIPGADIWGFQDAILGAAQLAMVYLHPEPADFRVSG